MGRAHVHCDSKYLEAWKLSWDQEGGPLPLLLFLLPSHPSLASPPLASLFPSRPPLPSLDGPHTWWWALPLPPGLAVLWLPLCGGRA